MAVDGSLKFDTKIDTNGFNKGTEQITKSAKAQAATLAAIYRKQGMSQSDAFKKAWAETERTAKTSTTKVKSDIAGIGNQATKSAKSIGGTLTGSLKKLISVATIAFLGSQIIQFSKASIQASNDIENAMIGLKSIVEGQGRDFSQANKFIQEYTSDGLIPATEAVTAYKNLAMRGYTDPQIQSTLTALKDSAAFGRQASLTMGQAVSGATEGLKNENSLLVDNAGVTKNVSMMWKDYAKSIGVGVESLTKEQKIQAEVNGILEETRFQTGDAAKVSETYSGKVLQLQFGLNNLKIAFGNFIKPIIAVIIPAINAAIGVFTRFFNTLAQISSALFGVKTDSAKQSQKQADAVGDTVKNEKDLAKATEKASKAAKSQLAGFDELQVLSKQAADGASGGDDVGGGTITPPAIGGENSEIGGGITITPEVQKAVDKIREILEPLNKIKFDNLTKAFDNLKTAIAPFTKIFFDGLNWFLSEILVPLSKWIIEDYLPAWLGAFASQLNFLSSAIDAASPLLNGLWNGIFEPMAKWTGGKIVDLLGFVAEQYNKISDWFKSNQPLFEAFGETIGKLTSRIWEFIEPIADTVWEAFKGIISTISDVLLDIATSFVEFANKTYTAVLAVTDFLDSIGILDVLQAGIKTLITNICSTFESFVSVIGSAISYIIDSLGFFMDFITSVFTGDWNAAWEAIVNQFCNIFGALGEIFMTIWNMITASFETFAKNFSGVWQGLWKGIGNFFISILNGIITAFENTVNWIINGVNGLLKSVNGMLSGASGLLSKIGVDVNLNIPTVPTIKFGRLPALARGAVIPPNREFMAVLGDQKSGTNIEAPLDTITQAMLTALNANNVGSGGNDSGIGERIISLLEQLLQKDPVIELDGDAITKSAINGINSITQRTGRMPIGAR